MGKSN